MVKPRLANLILAFRELKGSKVVEAAAKPCFEHPIKRRKRLW
jgi:hypothetical protein